MPLSPHVHMTLQVHASSVMYVQARTEHWAPSSVALPLETGPLTELGGLAGEFPGSQRWDCMLSGLLLVCVLGILIQLLMLAERRLFLLFVPSPQCSLHKTTET